MSGEFIYRHLEELRLKLFDSDTASIPIPMKDVDVMRQTHTSRNNVFEHVIDGMRSKRSVSF